MANILLSLAIVVLVGMANITVRMKDPRISKLFISFLFILNFPVFLFGLLIVLLSPDQLNTAPTTGFRLDLTNPVAYGIILQAMAVWGILVTVGASRQALFRRTTIKQHSPIHILGLLLIGYLAGNVALIFSQGGIEQLAESAEPATLADVVLPAVLFLTVAFAGVGYLIRRSPEETLRRLGLVRPSAAQLWAGTGWVVILLFLQGVTGAVWSLLDPSQVELLTDINETLLSEMDTVWEWALLALAAGVGEEILFRGALQPIFGIPLTAVLFALGHVQYGLSPGTVLIFVLGILLGLIRQRHNTTVAIYVHALYNFILGMLALLAPYLERYIEETAALIRTLARLI